MSYQSDKLKVAIDRALIDHGMELDEKRQAIVFHMTDWIDDLSAVNHLFSDPDVYDGDEIHQVLVRFLTHVPNHLAAASKLFLGIPVTDVFDVGSTTEIA